MALMCKLHKEFVALERARTAMKEDCGSNLYLDYCEKAVMFLNTLASLPSAKLRSLNLKDLEGPDVLDTLDFDFAYQLSRMRLFAKDSEDSNAGLKDL